MVPAYYIFRYPYSIIWHIKKWFGKTEGVVLYCANVLDYQIFAPVQKYLQPLPVVAKDKKAQLELAAIGVKAKTLPSFPDGVIMCRHAAYRFPAKAVKKVGLRHGAYHFKPFASTDSYNLVDKYLMSSRDEVEKARAVGIRSGVAVGFPKLDPAFDGSYDGQFLDKLRSQLNLAADKKTILLTSTWDKSGLSAIDQWITELSGLTQQYNVLVTVHPWVSQAYIDKITSTPGVVFLGKQDAVPYIMLADVCVGDNSSILAECCALDKPMVTFSVAEGKRTVPHVRDMIRQFSLQISDSTELPQAIAQCVQQPDLQRKQRQAANKTMFDSLDGKAGLRAAQQILELFPPLAKQD